MESSRDGLDWRALLTEADSGDPVLTTGFDPRPIRYLRVSVSETAPGFVPGIREIAVYERREDLPAAFPDFVHINGRSRARLATVDARAGEGTMRLSPDWRVAARARLPAGEEVVEVIPTASGGAFVLGQNEESGGRVVHLATPHDGALVLREFLPGLSATTAVAWDGEWFHTLDGGERTAYRDTDGDGAADERWRLGKIRFPSRPSETEAVEVLRFRAGPDGWFYALVTSHGKMSGEDSRRDSVRPPRHALLRFRPSGHGLHVRATGATAPRDFFFGKAGAIFVRLETDSSDEGDGGEPGKPDIRPLTPLAGTDWKALPPLHWPPTAASSGEEDFPAVISDRNRIYSKGQEGLFTLLSEVEKLRFVTAGGGGLWGTRAAGEGNEIFFLTPRDGAWSDPVIWDEIATEDLLSHFASPDPAVRTEGVFEVLRRKRRPLRQWEQLLASDAAPEQVEGVFAALSAIGGEPAPPLLLAAATGSDPVRQAIAFRHLGDHPGTENHPVYAEIGRATVPALTAGILSAMDRSGTTTPGLDELVLSFAGHPDALLAATARAYLQARASEDVCFAALDDDSREEAWPVAFAVLSGIRRTSVVEGIVRRLEYTRSARKRVLGHEALVALYHDDASTRRPWEGTALVKSYLETALGNHRVDRAALLRRMSAAGIPLPPPSVLLALAEDSIPLEAFVIDALSPASGSDGPDLPESAIPWLEKLADSPPRDPALRSRARALLSASKNRENRGNQAFADAERENHRPGTTAGEWETEALAARVALPVGDPFLGRLLFERLACHACHPVPGAETSVGPDLANSLRSRSLSERMEALLVRESAAPYRKATVFEMESGRRLSAFVVDREEDTLQLRDRVGNLFSLSRSEVTGEVPRTAPLQVCDATSTLAVDEFASLLRYLESLPR